MTRKTLDELLREARSRLDRLDPAQAHAAQAAGALIVDTRSHDERRVTGIIPGSIHIARSVLEWRVDLDSDPAYRNPHVVSLEQWIVLVCAHGYSSSFAAATLHDLGFMRATDMIGGFTAWKEQGLPVRTVGELDASLTPGMGDPDR